MLGGSVGALHQRSRFRFSGDGVAGSIANGHVVPGPICSLTLGRSGLFYCNLAIISYYDIVGFVYGDRSIISEDRQHCYAHAEIRGQETVAEDGFELIVVGSSILDACHRLNWEKR